jgi:hypothetical protein
MDLWTVDQRISSMKTPLCKYVKTFNQKPWDLFKVLEIDKENALKRSLRHFPGYNHLVVYLSTTNRCPKDAFPKSPLRKQGLSYFLTGSASLWTLNSKHQPPPNLGGMQKASWRITSENQWRTVHLVASYYVLNRQGPQKDPFLEKVGKPGLLAPTFWTNPGKAAFQGPSGFFHVGSLTPVQLTCSFS